MNTMKKRLQRIQMDDQGFTLVELLVAMIIFSLLIVMTVPLVDTFFKVDSNVTNSVGTVGQILPATTVLERYIRSTVSPAPSNPPTPFAPVVGNPVTLGYPAGTLYQVGTNQMSFYSNTGDLNASGVAIGPRLVTLSITGPLPKTGYTLTLQNQMPIANTCPGSSTAMSQAANATCSYAGQPSRLDFSIGYVSNGSQTDPNPIFQYIVGITASGLPSVIVPGSAPIGWTCGTYTCVPVTAAAIATVTGVQIDMETQNSIGALTSFRTTVIYFANNYSPNVG
jgi:prepilin-type N-terminal cleavage/methylation domain-containing protein